YKNSNYKHIKLRWKHEDHIFESTYGNVESSKANVYCPKCYRFVDQQLTLEATKAVFDQYLISDLKTNIRLAQLVRDPRILLTDKYSIISHSNVHIDISGTIRIEGYDRVIYIRVEHQGAQHTNFNNFLALSRFKEGIDDINEFRDNWLAMLDRDEAKVDLFKELNKYGYFLIVVDHTIDQTDRPSYIWNEFMRQFLAQTDLSEWL
ncbi:hypothetical protein LCGC14_3038630, partial [marine sediment metagenome]